MLKNLYIVLKLFCNFAVRILLLNLDYVLSLHTVIRDT